MLQSEEKRSPPPPPPPLKLLVPLPKLKNRSSEDLEDVEAGQGEGVREKVEEESGDDNETDEAPRGYMHPQLQQEFVRLAVR